MKSLRFFSVLGFCAIVTALAFPLLPGCGTLDPSGVYNKDLTLYRADAVITSSYSVLHEFVLFEYQNRALLASQPEVKQAADNVRLHARDWISSAIDLREAYAANPTSDNQSKLKAAIAILSTALTEATKYLNAGTPAAAPTVASGSATPSTAPPAAPPTK